MTRNNGLRSRTWLAIVLALLIFLLVPVGVVLADVGGTVFRDYDADGTNDSGEPGMVGITVTAYNASGAQVDQTQTDANGDYTLTGLTDTEEYRIEFTGLPSYLQPGPCGVSPAILALLILPAGFGSLPSPFSCWLLASSWVSAISLGSVPSI